MKLYITLFLSLICLATAQPSYQQEADAALPHVLEVYEWFHRHPELSRKEKLTSERLAEELRAIGLEVTERVGGFGVIGVLKGRPDGPVVLYRADMDALPIQEATGLPYASENPGVMHACGHDIHMSCALGVLTVLAQIKDQWSGTVLFVGQPAEEVGSGAEAIIADPKFQAILKKVGTPKLALALHDDAALQAGSLAVTPGFITANVDSVNIIVHGLGGHGARPNLAIDPIVIGSEIVTALQTIVSRRLPPGTRAVVTVGVFKAGTKRNIIPPTAELKLTIRSYEPKIRQQIVDEIRLISKQIAAAHHAPTPPTIEHLSHVYTPAGFNNVEWAKRLRSKFQKKLGKGRVQDVPPRIVGEDFSVYSRRLKIPSVMFMLGAGKSDGSTAGLHSDKFAPEAEETLRTGIDIMVSAILEAQEN